MVKNNDPQPGGHINHRTRVGEERRGKTRARLIKGALHVFAKHGADAKVIDLVIREAGVARGTFYNHFRSNEELFAAVAKEVSNEIIRIVDPLVRQQADPAARIACGVSTVVKLAITYPDFAQFVSRGGPLAVSAGSLATKVVPRDVDAGIATGRFSVSDKNLAFDIILGPVIMAFHRVLSRRVPKNYPEELAQAVLQSLGVSKALAKRYASQSFGEIEISEDSLFARPLGRITSK